MRFLLISVLLLVANPAWAQDSRPGVVTSAPVVYKIKMQTTFTVPLKNDGIDVIRVWHALPTFRPWSSTNAEVGASKIKHSTGGVQKYRADHNSHHNYWKIDKLQKPGKKHTFTTQFVVRSVFRDFQPEMVDIQWEDYQTDSEDPEARVDPANADKVHPQIAALADQIKLSHPPAAAVQEFCKWIKNSIKYDATVPYSTSNIDAIVENRKGHCGHRYRVFRQLCWRSGIPIRRVWGLSLKTPKGRGRLHEIKADYTNVHTWAEVYFPGTGWIEVEPSNGKNAFQIRARFVQNNPWFQNYSIWIRENGKAKKDTWTYNQGKYTSDYGVENIIRFSKRSL